MASLHGNLLLVDAALRRKLYRDVRRHLNAQGVSVTWIEEWEGATAFPALREAILPRIRTPEDYLVALHEIGHIAYPNALAHAFDDDVYGIVVCEGAAWAWASAAIPAELAAQIPADAWKVVGECFSSHARWASVSPTTPCAG